MDNFVTLSQSIEVFPLWPFIYYEETSLKLSETQSEEILSAYEVIPLLGGLSISRRKQEEISLTREIISTLSYLEENLKIKIADYDKILEYLSKFPDILDLVKEMCQSTRRYFPEAKLVLDKYKDPEIEDEFLVLYIRYPTYNEVTIEMLRQGVDEISFEYKDAFRGKKGWFMICHDFKTA